MYLSLVQAVRQSLISRHFVTENHGLSVKDDCDFEFTYVWDLDLDLYAIGFIVDVVDHALGSSRPLILTIHVVVRSHVETRDLV